MIAIARPAASFSRAFALAACAALLSLMLVAAQPARAATEIQFWHSMDGALGEALSTLISRFNASQNDVKVVADYKGPYPDTLATGLAAAQSGKPPHLLQVWDLGTADMMASPKLFKPAFQLAAEWGLRFDREEYFPPLAAYYADASGRLLALPFNASTPVLFINRDLFFKAGVDPDKPPKTWPEMQLVLLALQKGGVTCPYTTATQAWIHLENLSALHNQAVASQNNGLSGERAELLFNGRLMIRHISLLSAWAKSDLFRFAGRSSDSRNTDEHFANGECAMLTASSAAYADIVRSGRFKASIAPLPHYDDFPNAPYNTLLGGGALWTLSGHPPKEYQSVARFLAWLATPAVAAEWHQATGYVPMSRGAYLASKNAGFYTRNPQQEVGVEQLRGAHQGNFAKGVRLRNFAEIRGIVDEELNRVWDGGKAPKDALDEAVERGNVVLRRGLPPERAPAAPAQRREAAKPPQQAPR